MPNIHSHSNVLAQYSSLGLIEDPEKSQIPALNKNVAFANDHSKSDTAARPASHESTHFRHKSQEIAHSHSAKYQAEPQASTSGISVDLATSCQRAALQRPAPFAKSQDRDTPNLGDAEYVLQIGPKAEKIEAHAPLYYDLTEPKSEDLPSMANDQAQTRSSADSSLGSSNHWSNTSSNRMRDSLSNSSTDTTISSTSFEPSLLGIPGDSRPDSNIVHGGGQVLGPFEPVDVSEETMPASRRIQAKLDRPRLRALSPVIEHPPPPISRKEYSFISDAEVSHILRNTRPPKGLPDPPDILWKDDVEVVEGIEVTTQNADGTRIPEYEAKEVNALSPDQIAPIYVPKRPASPPPPAGYEETKHIGARVVNHHEPETVASNIVVGKGHLPETALLAAESRTPQMNSGVVGEPHIEQVMSDGRTRRLA